jgi:hypothetical protein
MIKFELKNVNPKKKNTTDCVIRALTTATNKDYYEVYEELYALSKKTGYFINEKRLEDKFLEQNGFIKMKQPRKWDNTKYQLSEIDKLIGKDEVAVVRIAGHLTCVKNWHLIDTWDCSYKTISNYYILRR